MAQTALSVVIKGPALSFLRDRFQTYNDKHNILLTLKNQCFIVVTVACILIHATGTGL